MIHVIFSLLFDKRLDRMTKGEIEEAVLAGTLTFSEIKRLAALDRYIKETR